MRVVIAAGGTAGHVVPALAVADALRAEGADVTFIGGDRAEATLVPQAGYGLCHLRVEGISRSNPLKALRALLRAVGAFVRSMRLLKRIAPDVVLGGGGYVAGPVGLAAVLRRIPLVLTEADSHFGLTNRLLAPFAKRACLAFPIAGREGGKYLVTGRPVNAVAVDRAAVRSKYGIGDDESLLLVCGGSLGARSINQAAVAAFTEPPPRVIHLAGERDFASLTAPGSHYQLLKSVDNAEFNRLLAASDLVVARAGGSIFEIAAYSKPAVLIPYPHASADHQTLNAQWMVDAGAAAVIPDDQLSPERLAEEVQRLLGDHALLAVMATASAALARPDAAVAIARTIKMTN